MTTKKAEAAARIAANKQAAWFKGLSILTGHIFSRLDRPAAQAAYDAGRSYDDYAAELAAKEPVGRALHPRKADAIQCAADEAVKRLAKIYKDMEAAGWDLEVAAPYPNSLTVGRDRYKQMVAKRNLFSMVTEDANPRSFRNRGEPDMRRASDKGSARFIDSAKQDAAFQYDKFICKMVAKIGAGAKDAAIEGNHIWGNSILTVSMEDGSAQRWHTQQIWNVSCLGTVFPQWPSRLQK